MKAPPLEFFPPKKIIPLNFQARTPPRLPESHFACLFLCPPPPLSVVRVAALLGGNQLQSVQIISFTHTRTHTEARLFQWCWFVFLILELDFLPSWSRSHFLTLSPLGTLCTVHSGVCPKQWCTEVSFHTDTQMECLCLTSAEKHEMLILLVCIFNDSLRKYIFLYLYFQQLINKLFALYRLYYFLSLPHKTSTSTY